MELALDRAAFAKKVGLTPDPWQRDLLQSSASRVLLNCSRQAGKSTVSSVAALHKALYRPNSLVLVLAPSLRQSQELFSKVTGFYRELAWPVPAHAQRRLSLDLTNGSRIVSLPGTEKTIRGFSGADLLVVDEAARVDDALFYAVKPMLAVGGGTLMMLSTPFGKRGAFFEAWANGEGWERYEVPASRVPRISFGFLEEERRNMPTAWFAQEYECRFVESSDQVFSHDIVTAALDERVEPLFGGG